MATIQVKRGLAANIPASALAGEPVFTTDDQILHMGTGAAIVPVKIAAANVTGLINGGVETVNAQVGTTYTVLVTDVGKLITISNAAAVAVSQPVAGFTSGQWYDIQNKGVGDATITPTSGTINGTSTFVLHTGQGVRVVYDGTNFQVITGRDVVAKSAVASTYLNSVNADGTFGTGTVAFTDITGTLAAAQLPATIDGGTF